MSTANQSDVFTEYFAEAVSSDRDRAREKIQSLNLARKTGRIYFTTVPMSVSIRETFRIYARMYVKGLRNIRGRVAALSRYLH